nr:MAG TPA: hypothetical protein [Caudoviricetes sp.]
MTSKNSFELNNNNYRYHIIVYIYVRINSLILYILTISNGRYLILSYEHRSYLFLA